MDDKVAPYRLDRPNFEVLPVAAELERNALSRDKDSRVIAFGLHGFARSEQPLNPKADRILNLDIRVNSAAAFHESAHLLVRVGYKGALEIFLEHCGQLGAREFNRGDQRIGWDDVPEIVHPDWPGGMGAP